MVKNKEKADLDKDGKISSYENKRGMAIEENMKKARKKAMGKMNMGGEMKSTKGYG